MNTLREAAQHTLVLAGAWNRRIFTPEWLHKHLGLSEDFTIEIPIEQVSQATILRTSGLSFILQADRLIVATQELTKASHNKAVTAASKLLELLPHTPLYALGINFGFSVAQPTTQMLEPFRALEDSARILPLLGEPTTTSIFRGFHSEGVAVNIKLSQTSRGAVAFEFNFHQDALDSASARATLARANEFSSQAERLLEEVYAAKLDPLPAE